MDSGSVILTLLCSPFAQRGSCPLHSKGCPAVHRKLLLPVTAENLGARVGFSPKWSSMNKPEREVRDLRLMASKRPSHSEGHALCTARAVF